RRSRHRPTQDREDASRGAWETRRGRRVRPPGVGGVVQHASPAGAARVRSARRVRAGLLQPPDGLGRTGHTHITEPPGKPGRFKAPEREKESLSPHTSWKKKSSGRG